MFCMMASSLVFVASGTTASDMMKMVGEKEGMLEDGCSLHTSDDGAAASSTARLCAEQPIPWTYSLDPAWLQYTEYFHAVFSSTY